MSATAVSQATAARPRARSSRWLAGLALACLAQGDCRAAAEEIQVYLDDLSAPGQFGLDLHSNVVRSGATSPSYAGERPPQHVVRLTPELYFGLTPALELGLYLLTAHPPGAAWQVDGAKVRLKYIAPHDGAAGGFWGVNLELGRTALTVSEKPWNAQFKTILGYRGGPWTLGANLNLDASVSSGGGPVALSLDLKAARAVAEHTELGLELYSELGPLRRPDALSRNPKTIYAVLDQEIGGLDVNLGLGRGLTNEADRWVLKLVVGTHF